ncbi:conjugative transposon protein TraM [Capnocytophaga sputigena]|uniref:conjugative transposon protein TraM n=1 Tax=Capnocytophaga sputigena TaxID=1019 RepID=UPI003C7936CF
MDAQTKKTYIFYGVIGAVAILAILAWGMMSSEKKPESDEIETPEKKREAYDSRLQAYNTEKQEANMGDLNKSFGNTDKKEANNTNSSQDNSLFADIDRQIANMAGSRQEPENTPPPAQPEPKQQTVPVKSGSASGGGGGVSAAPSTPVKKSRKELRNDRLQEEAKQAIARGDYNNPVIVSAKASQQTLNKGNDNTDFSEVDKYVPTASTGAPPARIDVKSGKPQKFSDLPATEQRRILLQTGQSQYKESEYIQAKIISTGKIKPGQTIYLMLQEDAVLSFRKIPRGTRIGGVVRMNDNRMTVEFSSINLKGEILDVTLDLYGTDGILGLPVSGEDVTREAKDEGINEAISRTGRVGRVIGSIGQSLRRTKDNSVDLGNNISCILRNRHKKE